MCGMIGYVGSKSALEVALDGLRRLEYRGYDSAGIAVVGAPGSPIGIERKAGKLANLEKALLEADENAPDTLTLNTAATAGMGHTRWATHGAPNDDNAHPHRDCTGQLAVIHNGIIENFAELRDELEKRGHELASDTDTEVVAHLLEEELGLPVDAAPSGLAGLAGPSAGGSVGPIGTDS